MSKVKGYVLTLTAQQYSQIEVDLEGVIDELSEISREVDWYSTMYVERLEMMLELLHSAKREEA